jgi:hypothetical protein
MSKTATFIKQLPGWTGDARLYALSKPLAKHKYVVVSAVNAMFSGPETYIFGCDEDGENVSYSELKGSFRGGRDHAQALSGAGYTIARAGAQA